MAPQRAVSFIAGLELPGDEAFCIIECDVRGKSQLEQRIAEQSARIASLEMDSRMYGVVRYPNGYTYNAGMSPFCAGGCGCGNV